MEKELIENNKLIAEFMGARVGGTGIAHFPNGNKLYIGTDKLTTKQTKYHSSWDWLMPVVEKIRRLDENMLVENIDINIDASVLIEGHEHKIEIYMENNMDTKDCLYKAVIEFIKWYNENK